MDYLKETFEENNEPPLSEKKWQAVRVRLITSDIFDGGEITLDGYPQFGDRSVPQSLRVDRIRLSDALVARIRNHSNNKDEIHGKRVKTKINKKPTYPGNH